MLIPIVDDSDIQIGFKERADVAHPDVYRVSALWLTNTRGDILITQRAFSKKNNPGAWSTTVAGTVEGDETYVENILKETEEEIGITLGREDIIEGPKLRMPSLFCQWYFAVRDVEVHELLLQEDEVIGARWISPEALRAEVALNPDRFVGSMPIVMDDFIALRSRPREV
jgi:isopentenyl-diphosphate delta-isomerase